MPLAILQPNRQLANNHFTEKYLRSELAWLAIQHPRLRFILRAEGWGYDLLLNLDGHELAMQLPLVYPSERIYIQGRRSDVASQFVRDYEQQAFHIFPPVSLTTLLKVFSHRLAEQHGVSPSMETTDADDSAAIGDRWEANVNKGSE